MEQDSRTHDKMGLNLRRNSKGVCLYSFWVKFKIWAIVGARKEIKIMIEEKINDACIELANILKEKNKKYGDSFTKTADEYGNAVLLLRIQDKLNRLKQILILKEPINHSDETALDTLLDLAGYAILAKLYLEDKK